VSSGRNSKAGAGRDRAFGVAFLRRTKHKRPIMTRTSYIAIGVDALAIADAMFSQVRLTEG
jgi:hypothetical protein